MRYSILITISNFCSSLIRDNHTQISCNVGDLSMNTSPWNKDLTLGQKRLLQISHIWGIRIRLELEGKTRDLTLFNMVLDSKLRGCDLVKLKVSDVAYSSSVSSRATICNKKLVALCNLILPA